MRRLTRKQREEVPRLHHYIYGDTRCDGPLVVCETKQARVCVEHGVVAETAEAAALLEEGSL